MSQVFDSLTYRSQLYRLRQLARSVLSYYHLQDAQLVLLQYEDNAVYCVTARSGKQFVLRVSAAEGYGAAEQNSEALWLTSLRQQTDLYVPEPVITTDGRLVVTMHMDGIPEPRHCVLFRWLPGKPPKSGISLAVMERVGAFTARLHNHAAQFVPPPGFVRQRWNWSHFSAVSSILDPDSVGAWACPALVNIDIWNLGGASPRPYGNLPQDWGTDAQALLSAVGQQARETLTEIGMDESAWGLIHADLHRDNILIKRGQVGVIDFDDCGWGYYLFDVASVLDSFSRRVATDTRHYHLLKQAYLTGYDRIRPLPANVGNYLRTFKALRDLVTLNFILRSHNARVQEWGPVRITAIMRCLQAYVDGDEDARVGI